MLDLDAARAARREALGEAPEFTFGGKTYALPPEMSYSAAIALQNNDLDAGLVHLLGPGNYDTFMEGAPAMEDIVALIEWIGEEYEGRSAAPDQEAANGTGKAAGKGKASRSKS